MTRTLISDDGVTQVWEVVDAEGRTIGTDEVFIGDAGAPTFDAAATAVSSATTVATLKAAVLKLVQALDA